MRLLVALVAVVVALTGCVTSERSEGEDGSGPNNRVADQAQVGDAGSGNDGTGRSEPAELAMTGRQPAAVIVGHANTPLVTAHEQPDELSPLVAELANPTSIGGPLAFQLVAVDIPEGPWVEVLLPVRPNGTTGWVRLADLDLSLNPFRIEVDRADHRLVVFRDGRRWLETEVAIGTGATPTPVGRFYIIELLKPPSPDGVYGPFAFGLSGFSETLASYAGGEGVIGIHGTNEPDAIGTDVSHGCIRVENSIISQLAGVIPLGTPVIIT